MSMFDDFGSQYLAGPLMSVHGQSVRVRMGEGLARTIKAIVDREQPEERSNRGRLSHPLIVKVRDDATDGIAASDLDDGTWEIEVAALKGETPRWRKVIRTVPWDQYGGLLALEVGT